LLQSVGSEVARKIEQNLYVDNVFGGEETVQNCLNYYREAVDIFSSRKMNLREWFSNSTEVMNAIPEKHRGTGEVTTALGQVWDTRADVLSCKLSKFVDAEVRTKRQVLKALASVYDPCGHFTPVTIGAKILMQELWAANLQWDERLPDEFLAKWNLCRDSIRQISAIKVSRQLQQSPYDEGANVQIHVFCDASKSAYSAAVYARIENHGKISVDLLLSKSRVSPVRNSLTVPKLELMAMLVGSRLLRMVRKELPVKIHGTRIWSDSICALHWAKQEKPATIFVRNRVKEIREQKDVVYSYIATAENPADLPTRANTCTDLANCDLWWKGPPWLSQPESSWPNEKLPSFPVKDKNEVDAELKEETACTTTYTRSDPAVIDAKRFSSLRKLHRVTARVFKFIDLLKKRTSSPDITADDIAKSRLWWLRQVQSESYPELLAESKEKKWANMRRQLSLFVDREDKLIRSEGRLSTVLPDSSNCPILLPPHHYYTRLVVEHMLMCMCCTRELSIPLLGCVLTTGFRKVELWLRQSCRNVSCVVSSTLSHTQHRGCQIFLSSE
jgi:hypothetical protein